MRKVCKTASVKKYQLPIEISKDGCFFLAKCPIWKDCYAQGKTIDEATTEVIAVAGSLIELYEEENQKIPLKTAEKVPFKDKEKISFTVPVFSLA